MKNTHPLDVAAMVLATSLVALGQLLLLALAHLITLALIACDWRPAPPPAPPMVHPLVALIDLPMADLRKACTAAGRKPGRSRITAMATLLA